MSLIQFFLKQLNEESETTCKMLARVPNDKYDWTPHVKSMDVRRLATHIAELPTWITMALTTNELDFEDNSYESTFVNNTGELMELFERALVDGRSQLIAENESTLDEKWTLRSGDTIHSVRTKGEVIRMALSQIIHHRAQLGVYLRLLNIPIPGSYGPSADEATFKPEEATV
ncbi:DinB family protein [Mucilaginibacter sp. AK015]|uniref:DinB family protein n=1 Tax=Mucilaginibacter sp. AK015 TaxID=2723072 RepID=UPI0016079A4B|nr:DinB family protein [Mucilaginibacter sp. AK015]MBB5397797.1 putative damage-inducible protein DinB [Mucilaginibacter sp. AK015]